MGELVKLYVYDLSVHDLSRCGLSSSNRSSCSSGVAGIPLAYHTSIVVFGKEYSFSCSDGITVTPLQLVVDKPNKTHELGCTRRRMNEFEKFVESLSNIFQARNYDLLRRNCQEFCIKLCEFLEVEGLPEYIRTLPKLARNSFGTQTGLVAAVGTTAAVGVVGIAAGLGFLLYKGFSKSQNNKN